MNRAFKKRQGSRIYYWTPITIQESGVSFLYRARLANYSRSGIYFETDLLLYPETEVYVGIQDTSHRLFSEDHGSFLVNIIWRKRLTEISFNYGYGAKLIFDEAKRKVQKNDHVELKELRKSLRKPFSKLAYFASGNKYYEGIIKNLNRSGAFIETKTKFSNRDEIKLVVTGPSKLSNTCIFERHSSKDIQIRCKIIHFKQNGFGVKFKSVVKIEKLH